MKIIFEPLLYNNFVRLYNMKDEMPCHALCYYAFNLGLYLEDNENNFENDTRSHHDPRQSLLSIAELYGVTPDSMLQFWPEIDRVFARHNFKAIPNLLKYRHVSVLRSHDGNMIPRITH
jgi:hypothetical protein